MRNNKPFLALLGSYLFQLTGIGIFTAMIPYFVVHVLQRGQDHVGYLFLLCLGTATLSMVVWGKLSNKIGKVPSYFWAIVIYGVSLIGLFFADDQSYMVEVSMICLGLGFAGLQVLPYSLLTDVTCYDRALTQHSREGMITGIWSACEKTGLAIGPLIAGTLLAFTGYIEKSNPLYAEMQPSYVLQGIGVGISLIPAVLVLLSLLILRKFSIPKISSSAPAVQNCE